ncbi:MAG: hypothetical protein K0S95_2535 [Pantoea eucrina]|jgi:hypothetical protein|nr:hypothetical protein [Pantoea eucrina]
MISPARLTRRFFTRLILLFFTGLNLVTYVTNRAWRADSCSLLPASCDFVWICAARKPERAAAVAIVCIAALPEFVILAEGNLMALHVEF